MRLALAVVFFEVCVTTSVGAQDAGEATLSVKDLETHVRYFASDEMKGRATGSEEAKQAAGYIQEHMERLKLKPAGSSRGSYEMGFSAASRVCRNVCGYVEGTDSRLKNEFLVFGAHFDHVGLGQFGSRTGARGQIHNGADDNASGSSALLELMEAFATKPARRSVLFLAFSGEELGLFGSKAWVKKPTVSMSKVVAMINLDMIGRSKNNYLFIGGLNTGTGFQELIEKVNKETKFDLELAGGGTGPSDFDPFYRKQVPVLFFFTAEHNEYHTPADDIELINFPDQHRITVMAYRVGRALGDGSKRPKWQEDDRQAMPASSSRGKDYAWTMLGVKVGAAEQGKQGVPVTEVRRNSSGDKTGMKEGDRIVLVDGVKAESPQALQSVLALARPGAKAKVKIERGGRVLTASLLLE